MALEEPPDERETAPRAQRVDPKALAAELGRDIGRSEKLGHRGAVEKEDRVFRCLIEGVEMEMGENHALQTLA